MSGFGGFGGFGQNNQNNNTSSGFGGGGFGGNNNTSGGFGSSNSTTNTGFGSGGSLFGGGNTNNANNNAATTSFGGFGSGNAFGQNKTGFGTTAASSGGSLFGGNTATAGTGFGGFGGSGPASTGFGNTNTNSGGGIFGSQNKSTGFGTSSGGGLFGGSNNNSNTTSTGFGSSAANTGFGTSNNTFNNPQQNNGTGSVPFSEVSEKEANASNQISKFQSITTMDAYKTLSFEELRLVDYSQGRKQGNTNGQAGAFGASTGFGGFGATNTSGGFGGSNTGGGLFGANNASTPSVGFGQQNTTTGSTGFGSTSTGGGLFGAKPSTGGLFGSTPTTSTQTTGGLFGTSGATNTGFGNNNTSTTGGLFGSNQAKPAFGGFGSSTQPSTGGGLFGNTATAGTTGFGQTQNQPASTGFSFGQNNTSQPAGQTGGGGLFGGGFGQNNNNQQKPGGLFGSSTTAAAPSGGLFGQNNNTQQSGGGLFGGANTNNQSTGGLFGAPKPATGLFGNSTTNTTGGLFGQSNQAQQSNGGLFGQTNNNQQQAGGLFGASKPAGGLGTGLFGGGNVQPAQPTLGGSLFGNSQQPAQQPGSSLFGISQPAQAPQQPGTLTASLLQNPYGNDALFANIGSPTQSVGPIATPLASSQKNKKQALIPAYKLHPQHSNRLTTPQKRGGYGFSYSTYGTPGSAIPNGSPFGYAPMVSPNVGHGRSLNKSMSTTNLRHSFSAEDSILNPLAFTSTVRGGPSRMKKLNIDKSLNHTRKPLFEPSTPEPPRKSVSFDTSVPTASAPSNLGPSNGALVRTESPPPVSETNGNATTNGAGGKALAAVPEDTSPPAAPAVKPPTIQLPASHEDQPKGQYWMKPTIEQIKKLPREQAANFVDFQVGCEGMGTITFSKVDLTSVKLDQIMGKIVDFEEPRKVSVYGDTGVTKKPPVGQGLNVPSTIILENSWPRSNAGATQVLEKKGQRYEKHIRRLKRIGGTHFIDYNPNSGHWTFTVDHYTTYGLDDDDDDLDTSVMQAGTGTPTPNYIGSKSTGQLSSPPVNSDLSLPSPPESSPDDTFDFKKGKRKLLPGQFDDGAEDEMADADCDSEGSIQSFLGERSVGSSVRDDDDASELGLVEDLEMAGSFPRPTRTTEPSNTLAQDNESMLVDQLSNSKNGTPTKKASAIFGDDWTEQLQRTVSPKKQDRAALRANQSLVGESFEKEKTPKATTRERPFATSMDIMNSLFNQSTRNASPAKLAASTRGFEHPSKRAKVRDPQATQDFDDAYHNSTKTSWGPNGTFVYIIDPLTPTLNQSGVLEQHGAAIVGEHNEVRFGRLTRTHSPLAPTILEQQKITDISTRDDVPYAQTDPDFWFDQFPPVVNTETPAGEQELRTWELAAILFDNQTIPSEVPAADQDLYHLRLRKEKVSEFWKDLVRADVLAHVNRAESLEEKAFAYLTGGLAEEACNALIEGKNFHLATLVAQIGFDKTFRSAMANQLESWHSLNILAEFEDPIRAIYELLAGNTCTCIGSKNATGLENMTSSFNMAIRFNLDWRRSFGLRLWYGIDPDRDVNEAVLAYLEDLRDELEEVKPVPWFIEQKASTGWTDKAAESREDILWTLLQLGAGDETDLGAAFAPEAVSGNPMDARLSFQLTTLFQAQSIGDDQMSDTSDSLAATFATDLASSIDAENPQFLVSAIWVLLHLSDAGARESSIRSLLDQHAGVLGEKDGPIFAELHKLQIPPKWLFTAKALYARAVVQDPVREAQALLDANEWYAAHEVVCRTVGPNAVISNDADQLRELLGGLHDPTAKQSAYRKAWQKGAGVYYDFVEMRDLERQRGQKWKELVNRLVKALEQVSKDGLAGRELLERASLQIMADTVAEYAIDDASGVRTEEVLDLPLKESRYLDHSRKLVEEYYRSLAGAAK